MQNFIGKRNVKHITQYNSSTEAAHMKIVAESNNYMYNDTPVGELLFKLMMKKSTIDTRATSTHLMENLTSLNTYMSTVNLDIENFNQYVEVNVDGLKERCERTDNLMINLFKAYQVASDSEFFRYTKTKQDQYDDG